MLARRDVRLLLLGAVLAVCWLAGREAAGLQSGVLYLVPVLALLVPLLLQRYPGERGIIALARRMRRRSQRAWLQPRIRVKRSLLPTRAGAGEVLAYELAGRAPPLLS